jgi:hypothetical protein
VIDAQTYLPLERLQHNIPLDNHGGNHSLYRWKALDAL